MPNFLPSILPFFLSLFFLLLTPIQAEILGNQTIIDGPLFAKYQFLSPGIIMGFTVGVILLAILYVGVAALGSLEITHAAFEKESGPGSSGKKNQ